MADLRYNLLVVVFEASFQSCHSFSFFAFVQFCADQSFFYQIQNHPKLTVIIGTIYELIKRK